MKALILFITLSLSLSCQSEKKSSIATSDTSFAKSVSAQEASQLAKNSDLVILDVRTPPEYESGHLKNAQLVNWFDDDFNKKVETIDKKKTVLLYCRSGGRSSAAMKRMKTLGFEKLYNMSGGILSWSRQGFDLTK